MSAQGFESVLARLYVDPDFRRTFLDKPEDALLGLPLTVEEQADLLAIDRAGLVMAAHSYYRKRMNRGKPDLAARVLRKVRECLVRPFQRFNRNARPRRREIGG